MNTVKIYLSQVFPSNIETGEIGSVKMNVWLAQITGVPILGLKPETNGLKKALLLQGIFITSLVTLAYTAFEMYDLAMNCNDLDSLTQNTCLSLTHVSGVLKAFNLLYNLPKVRQLIKKLEYVTRTFIKSEKQLNAFYNGELENKIVMSLFISVVGTTGILAIAITHMYPAVVSSRVFPFHITLPSWMPQAMQLVYMNFSLVIFALQIVAVDYLNVTIINQIRFQLNVLNLSFDELIVDIQPNARHSKWIMVYDGDPIKRLNSIIQHHILLRELQQETEDIFNKPILWQFFTSLIIFAMTGFQATVRPGGSFAAVLIYAYCGCIFSELFVYCWFGNEVFEQSKTLATSGYNSSWYHFDRRYASSLLLFLTNAQRPFLFTAGGFMGLSLPSFAGILSKSYSYIALLRQLYGD